MGSKVVFLVLALALGLGFTYPVTTAYPRHLPTVTDVLGFGLM